MTKFQLAKVERTELEHVATHIYRHLTTSEYVKDVKYSEYIHFTKQQLNKTFFESTHLLATVHLIDCLLKLANKFRTFAEYENRFERYITLLLKKQYPLLESWWEKTYFHRRIHDMTETFLYEIKPSIAPFTYDMIEKCLLKVKFHVWQAWLQNPTFEGYKNIQATFSAEEKNTSLNYILNILQQNLLFPPIQQTYVKILSYERRYEEIARYMLTYERQPLLLSEEKKACLQAMEKHTPQLLLPVYHQFVVRLIERKTRSHYEEAIRYMKKLQKLYNVLNKHDVFLQYLHQLKKKYQSYRALIQELKNIETNVQSK